MILEGELVTNVDPPLMTLKRGGRTNGDLNQQSRSVR